MKREEGGKLASYWLLPSQLMQIIADNPIPLLPQLLSPPRHSLQHSLHPLLLLQKRKEKEYIDIHRITGGYEMN